MKFVLYAMGLGFLCFLSACHDGHSKQPQKNDVDSTYTLSGKIKGLDSGFVYLEHTERAEPRLDSVLIQKGRFSFTGKADTPEICFLGIREDGAIAYKKLFFIQNGTLNFSGRKDSLNKASITGSVTQDEYRHYTEKDTETDSVHAAFRTAYKAATAKKDKKKIDSLEKVDDSLQTIAQQVAKTYILAHPGSYASAFILYSDLSYTLEPAALDSICRQLDIPIQKSYYGRKLDTLIMKGKLTSIGQPAPAFTQNDTSGKPVALSSFKGNYVLIDFWASWCGPCRRENPSVVKAYKKFHPKGFSIVGISLDEEKSDWLKAIQKDGLEWTQVSDLKGWKNEVSAAYGINAIPMNFLLDKEGKIIARGLRGEELDKKLQTFLH